ncbi:chorismate mutase [Streptomyces sp. NPDC007929]|uniref:chorismate mutase n=1 Tax=unclassified Streptomyces TaxID=2593676 RepID=UPI0036EA3930
MSWAYCAPKSTTRTVSAAVAAGVADDTGCLPAVGRGSCATRFYRGAAGLLPCAGRSPRLSMRTGLDGPWRGCILAPCSSTRRSSLPMASGPPDAMVVLLEQLTSDFPGAPGRQGPGRLSSSGPCRPGAAPDDEEPPMTAIDVTGARTPEAAGVITGARERIDALDDRIIGLIQERVAVSAVIQEARIASGGRRVNLSREMDVLGHYREALGKPGTALAMTLLELCRGKI